MPPILIMGNQALPDTVHRVPESTADVVNERIRRATERNVARVARGGAGDIHRRLRELDREWDIERTLETNAATVSLVGLGLGALVHRGFYSLPAIVAIFLLQHALQGWCPPLPVFRRRGVRTAREIEEERYALKALRGDFRAVPAESGEVTSERVAAALEAASEKNASR